MFTADCQNRTGRLATGLFVTFVLTAFGFAQQIDSQGRPIQPAVITAISSEQPSSLFMNRLLRSSGVIGDAALNDIASLGDDCWVVGERGVILTSHDGGQTFATSMLPRSCSLTSVCFLTNQIGFVAGGDSEFSTGESDAVLLKTVDGGKTWIDLTSVPEVPGSADKSAGTLPALSSVRFFDLDNGIAVAEPSTTFHSGGVFRTTDGGISWKLLEGMEWEGDIPFSGLAADFLSPQAGLIVGEQSGLSAIVGNRLISLAPPQPTLRKFHDVRLVDDSTGWIAGDSGSLLNSTDRGLTWNPIVDVLPSSLVQMMDFTSVAATKDTVIVGGMPGGCVYVSRDGGRTWQRISLPETTPLRRLRFLNDSTVLALGEFGIIMRSKDAGLSWTTIRNREFRAATLAFCTDAARTPTELNAKICANEGFRSAVVHLTGRLTSGVAVDRRLGNHIGRRLQNIGVSSFQQDWMFARTRTGDLENSDELLKNWQRLTDGNLVRQLPDRLALWIRSYRPDVICLEPSESRDAAADLIRQALPVAVRIAAGEGPVSNTIIESHLPAWNVSRVVQRVFDGRRGSLTIRRDEHLPLAESSVDLLVRPFDSVQVDVGWLRSEPFEVVAERDPAASDASYEVLLERTDQSELRHIMSGILHAPGTASRRLLTPIQSDRLQRQRDLLQRSAQQAAIHSTKVRRSENPLGLIAEINSTLQGLPADLAIRQLEQLANTYESANNVDGQISVLKELVERFPTSEASVEAALVLHRYFCSAELRRLRRQKTVPSNLNQQAAVIQTSGTQTAPGSPVVPTPRMPSQPFADRQSSDLEALDHQWDRNADAAFQHLQKQARPLSERSDVLLQRAAMLRRSGQSGKANSATAAAARIGDPFSRLAQAEINSQRATSLDRVATLVAHPADNRPFLDGVLDEECWANAKEIRLQPTATADSRLSETSFVLLCWDEDYFYVGGRIPSAMDRPPLHDPTIDRQTDSDHFGKDRFVVEFDVDRDFATSLSFTIDESGQVSDRCWKDRSWNPEWFVATEADESAWRFEAAISMSALVQDHISPGDLWSIRLARVAPGVGRQVLVHENSKVALPDDRGVGLLRFLRK